MDHQEKASRFSNRGCSKFITCLTTLVVVLLLAGLLLMAGAIYIQVIILTTPFRNQNIGTRPGFIDVSLTTADDVQISGWYMPGTRPEAIILVHGIHANRTDLIPQAAVLAQAGYHLLMLDLRGHGFIQEAFMTYGYREALDVQAGVDYLLAVPGVTQVGALGHSLGAAAVVRAAANDERLSAIVIQSSYSSLPQAAADAFDNFSVFPKWPFAPLIIALAEHRTGVSLGQVDSARDLATMPARPILIIHSKGDNLFLPYHAQTMYDAAQEPKELWLVDGLGHINPIHGHEAEYQAHLLNFFDNAFQARSTTLK